MMRSAIVTYVTIESTENYYQGYGPLFLMLNDGLFLCLMVIVHGVSCAIGRKWTNL